MSSAIIDAVQGVYLYYGTTVSGLLQLQACSTFGNIQKATKCKGENVQRGVGAGGELCIMWRGGKRGTGNTLGGRYNTLGENYVGPDLPSTIWVFDKDAEALLVLHTSARKACLFAIHQIPVTNTTSFFAHLFSYAYSDTHTHPYVRTHTHTHTHSHSLPHTHRTVGNVFKTLYKVAYT